MGGARRGRTDEEDCVVDALAQGAEPGEAHQRAGGGQEPARLARAGRRGGARDGPPAEEVVRHTKNARPQLHHTKSGCRLPLVGSAARAAGTLTKRGIRRRRQRAPRRGPGPTRGPGPRARPTPRRGPAAPPTGAARRRLPRRRSRPAAWSARRGRGGRGRCPRARSQSTARAGGTRVDSCKRERHGARRSPKAREREGGGGKAGPRHTSKTYGTANAKRT